MFQSKTCFNVSDCWLKLNGYQPFLNGIWKYPYWLEKATFASSKPLTKIHLWTTISHDVFKKQTNADVAPTVQSIQAERSSSWMNREAIFELYTEAVGVLRGFGDCWQNQQRRKHCSMESVHQELKKMGRHRLHHLTLPVPVFSLYNSVSLYMLYDLSFCRFL